MSHRHQSSVAFYFFIAGIIVSAPLHAHHSASAYNEDATMTISGVVDRLQWRNPHVIVRLEVIDQQGNKSLWPLETAGITRLIQGGWSKDKLQPGTKMTAEIRPTVKGIPGGILRWIILEDGSVLPIDRESPTGIQVTQQTSGQEEENDIVQELKEKSALHRDDYLARRLEEARYEASNRPEVLPKRDTPNQAGALDAVNRVAHKGTAVHDFTGIWQQRSNRELSKQRGGAAWEFLPVPELTEKARATQQDVLARREAGDATADPAALCYPHGLQRGMTRFGNMMLLQVETAVFMVHRMNNYYRAIFWDGRDHVPEDIRVDSYMGDSIAVWEDDHLFVETVGFGSAEHYINPGISIGKQGRVEERWRLINEGNTLQIEFRMTDPEHWIGEWIDTKYWDRIEGEDIREGHCILAEDADLAIGGNR